MITLQNELDKTISLLSAIRTDEAILGAAKAIADACARCIRQGGKVMFCGNGGSAADSQHLAAELVGKLVMQRPGMPGLSLTTDTSALTAIGNDYGFEHVFARQVEALGCSLDVLIGISTSGRSANVLEAFKAARHCGVTTIGLTGGDGGQFPPLCDHIVVVPSHETQKIQEAHIVIGHIICTLVEANVVDGRLAAET